MNDIPFSSSMGLLLTKAIADLRSPLGEPPEPQMPPKFSRKKVSFEISNWRNSGADGLPLYPIT